MGWKGLEKIDEVLKCHNTKIIFMVVVSIKHEVKGVMSCYHLILVKQKCVPSLLIIIHGAELLVEPKLYKVIKCNTKSTGLRMWLSW